MTRLTFAIACRAKANMGKRGCLRGLKEKVIVSRLIPGATGLAFHRARKEKEVWEAEERHALLQ